MAMSSRSRRKSFRTCPSRTASLVDAANKYCYSTSLGSDRVLQWKFDPAAGALSPNSPPEIHTKAGAGPRHLAFHPSGKFLYLITETTDTIGAYAIDPATGTLKELQFVNALPADFKEQPAAADLHVTPDGRFLYGSERKTSTLAGYRIDPEKGTLSPIGHWPTERTPRGFNIDPRGKFLLSVGLDSDAMMVYRIDPAIGRVGQSQAIRDGQNAELDRNRRSALTVRSDGGNSPN